MLSLEKLTKDLSFEKIDEVLGKGSSSSKSSKSSKSSSSSCSSSGWSSSNGDCGDVALLAGTANAGSGDLL